mmetsp:Transcript_11222/g.30212  ORF Transcript_11222/g.30212 Transcript_11222/m.30212 type:complete len:130 (-) Transcript_11222:386-775(-)
MLLLVVLAGQDELLQRAFCNERMQRTILAILTSDVSLAPSPPVLPTTQRSVAFFFFGQDGALLYTVTTNSHRTHHAYVAKSRNNFAAHVQDPVQALECETARNAELDALADRLLSALEFIHPQSAREAR